MSIRRGFFVSESLIPFISRLPERVRTAVIGASFARAYNLPEPKIPADSSGTLAALVDGIVSSAKEFDENGQKKKQNEAASKWLKRNPGSSLSDYVRRTKTDKSGQNYVRLEENRIEKKEVCDTHACPSDKSQSDTSDSTADERFPTVGQVVDWAQVHFCPVPPAEFLAEFHRRMTEGGWRGSRGQSLAGGRWQRELSAWWAQEQKNSARALRGDAPTAGYVPSREVMTKETLIS